MSSTDLQDEVHDQVMHFLKYHPRVSRSERGWDCWKFDVQDVSDVSGVSDLEMFKIANLVSKNPKHVFIQFFLLNMFLI